LNVEVWDEAQNAIALFLRRPLNNRQLYAQLKLMIAFTALFTFEEFASLSKRGRTVCSPTQSQTEIAQTPKKTETYCTALKNERSANYVERLSTNQTKLPIQKPKVSISVPRYMLLPINKHRRMNRWHCLMDWLTNCLRYFDRVANLL